MVKLSKRSQERLQSVREPLRRVILEVCRTCPFDITILEGIRTLERQKQLVAEGRSQTMNSRHLTGDAIDIAPYPIDWNDTAKFRELSGVVKQASQTVGVPIEWGGDWRSFKDMPHYQIPWKNK